MTTIPPNRKGGKGVVFKAQWRRPGGAPVIDVAVKALRIADLESDAVDVVLAELTLEANKMSAAFHGGGDDCIVTQYGIALGAPTEAWRAHLGRALERQLLAVDSSSGDAFVGLVMRWEPGGSLDRRLL